jgi:hypothetical protein
MAAQRSPYELTDYEKELSEEEFLQLQQALAKATVQRQLAQLKQSAKTLTDIELWARHYPWATVGAAAAGSFALAAAVTPRRRKAPPPDRQAAPQAAAAPPERAAAEPEQKQKSALGSILGFIPGMLMSLGGTLVSVAFHNFAQDKLWDLLVPGERAETPAGTAEGPAGSPAPTPETSFHAGRY